MKLSKSLLGLTLLSLLALFSFSCATSEQQRLARCPEHLEDGPTAYDSCKPGYVPQYYSGKTDEFRVPASAERH